MGVTITSIYGIPEHVPAIICSCSYYIRVESLLSINMSKYDDFIEKRHPCLEILAKSISCKGYIILFDIGLSTN